ncbi:MAG: hypothetical protein Q8L87_18995, partial [Anaerolineales bacterium]|nr:hypothetical protein [Anaerolineales bacterium]
MGKKWDDNKGGREQWIKWLSDVMAEGLRVLKPGGHALVWALPRTSHWTGFALENAGFEVRDIVHHLFGSGFPKSLSIDKAIDKMKGAERVKVIDERWATKYPNGPKGKTTQLTNGGRSNRIGTPMKELPTTPEAKEWEGWGTALKPAVECWWLVRKP